MQRIVVGLSAVIAAVGIYDMLRYETFPNGVFNVTEFGTVKEADGFKALYAMSAYHHIKDHTPYPAVMVTTADHDDRVVPAHSFKFAAALQAAQSGAAPTIIRIETSAGHGAGTPTSKQIEKLADTYAFLYRVLQVERKQ